MNNDLQEIKNLITDGFKGVAEMFEHQNEYIDKQINEVGKENQRHLEVLMENHKHEIQAVGEQYMSLYNKVKEHDEVLAPLSR